MFYKKKVGFIFLVAFFMMLLPSLTLAGEITIVTENYPPYTYLENNTVKGVSAEVVQAVLKELKMKVPIKVYPWPRAYKMALTDPNTLIFSIGRSPQRETLFKWIGVIAPADQVLFCFADRKDIKISSLKDMKKYKIGTVRDDLIEQYLLANGFKLGINIDQCDNYELLMRKFLAKRYDLCAVGLLVGYRFLENFGYQRREVRNVYRFDSLSNGLYMAFQKDTPDKTVRRFRHALKKVKADKTFDRIVAKYNMGPAHP